MTIAKILVPMTGSSGDAVSLRTAFFAAAPFQAHVEALFVHPDPRELVAYAFTGAAVAPTLIQGVVDGQLRLAEEAKNSAHSRFVNVAGSMHARVVPAPTGPRSQMTCSFHAAFGYIPNLVADAARFADLVVFKPVENDERPDISGAILETLTSAGRPVLLAAKACEEKLAQKIVLAWDGGNAAVHAATAALPFLERADSVEILTIETAKQEAVSEAAALKEYLGLHGVSASVRKVHKNGGGVGDALLREATKSGADLLVMGGYGHSHLREAVLGGATLDVVSHHALPVLLMH